MYIFLYITTESRHDAATGGKFIQGINFAKLKPPLLLHEDGERKGEHAERTGKRMKTERESSERWRGILHNM